MVLDKSYTKIKEKLKIVKEGIRKKKKSRNWNSEKRKGLKKRGLGFRGKGMIQNQYLSGTSIILSI